MTVTAKESISIIGRDGDRSALVSKTFGASKALGGEKAGDAGDVVVSAPVLIVSGGSIVARTIGDGNAGNIEVRVGRLELTGGGQIFNGIGRFGGIVNGEPAFEGTGGPGQGGKLTVIATEAIFITGQDSEGFRSGFFSNAHKGTGRTGDLSVSTPSLVIARGLHSDKQ